MRFKEYYYEEVVSEDLNLLFEGLPIKNFNKNIPSHINKKYFKLRQKEGNTGSFLKRVQWNKGKNTLTLFFEVTPTPTRPIKVISRNGKISKGSKFKSEIQFEDVSDYIGNLKDFLEKSKTDQTKLIRGLVKTGTVNLHSNDMSWIWQGVWRRAQDNNYNIYPVPANRMKDKGIWLDRHGKNIYCTKHIMEIMTVLPFLSNTIAKMIREKYS